MMKLSVCNLVTLESRRDEMCIDLIQYTAISIKFVPEQSGKVEYEREKLAGSND